jgi:putative transposase
MPEYRRVCIPGATVFITMVAYQRSPIFTAEIARQTLHDAWITVEKRTPFTTDAICVLPDHIHAMITLPECDANYSLRIREIKRLFTMKYTAGSMEIAQPSSSRIRKKEVSVWQRRFWEHTIRDERDYEQHFDYIHYNPVRHSLVDRVIDWPWSSFHRYVHLGLYEPEWGVGKLVHDDKNSFGE